MISYNFYRASLFNLEHYLFILDESVLTAARALQIWFDYEKILLENHFAFQLIYRWLVSGEISGKLTR